MPLQQQHHKPESLMQGRMDPRGLWQILTLTSECCRRNGGSSLLLSSLGEPV